MTTPADEQAARDWSDHIDAGAKTDLHLVERERRDSLWYRIQNPPEKCPWLHRSYQMAPTHLVALYIDGVLNSVKVVGQQLSSRGKPMGIVDFTITPHAKSHQEEYAWVWAIVPTTC